MVLILVSMDRGSPYLYTGSKYRGIKRFLWKFQEGGCNNHLLEDVLQKIPQEDEGYSKGLAKTAKRKRIQ